MPETPPRRPLAASRAPRHASDPMTPSRGAVGDDSDDDDLDDPRVYPGDAEDSPRVTITSIAELVRIIPHQIGFVPTESLVIQCLEQDGTTRVMRVDLPVTHEAWQQELELTDSCAYLSAHLDPDRDECLIALYSQHPSAVLLAGLARDLLRRRGRPVLAAVVVDHGEILTLAPDDHSIADRSPVDAPDSSAITALKVANILQGRRTLADRSELAASVAAPVGIGEAVGRRAVASLVDELDRPTAGDSSTGRVPDAELRAVLDDALAEVAEDGLVRVGTAARLAVHCWHPADRDRLLARMLHRRSEPWVPMLISALRRIPAADSVDLCSVLVVIAYRAGDGALAQVAADRALATNCRHRLTLLMIDIMFAGLPPDSLDGMAESLL